MKEGRARSDIFDLKTARAFNVKLLNRQVKSLPDVGEHAGHMCELQLNTTAMLRAKETSGHRTFEVVRELRAAVKQGSTERVTGALTWGRECFGTAHSARHDEGGETLRECSVSAGGRAWLHVKARAQRRPCGGGRGALAAGFASDRKNQKTTTNENSRRPTCAASPSRGRGAAVARPSSSERERQLGAVGALKLQRRREDEGARGVAYLDVELSRRPASEKYALFFFFCFLFLLILFL